MLRRKAFWCRKAIRARKGSASNASPSLQRLHASDYLDWCHKRYSCAFCRAHLASHDELVSKLFQGNHGRAFLFNKVVNVKCAQPVQRELLTGLHAVSDIFCDNCKAPLGWKYEHAFVASQKYKEGKFIIEQASLIAETSVDVGSYNVRDVLEELRSSQSQEEYQRQQWQRQKAPSWRSDLLLPPPLPPPPPAAPKSRCNNSEPEQQPLKQPVADAAAEASPQVCTKQNSEAEPTQVILVQQHQQQDDCRGELTKLGTGKGLLVIRQLAEDEAATQSTAGCLCEKDAVATRIEICASAVTAVTSLKRQDEQQQQRQQQSYYYYLPGNELPPSCEDEDAEALVAMRELRISALQQQQQQQQQ